MELVEAYTKEQGLFRTDGRRPIRSFTDTLELDLATWSRRMAGPKRPQDRVDLPDVKKNFAGALRRGGRRTASVAARWRRHGDDRARRGGDRGHYQLHQHVEPVGDAGARACWRRRRWSAG